MKLFKKKIETDISKAKPIVAIAVVEEKDSGEMYIYFTSEKGIVATNIKPILIAINDALIKKYGPAKVETLTPPTPIPKKDVSVV
jgi:hypothetical protein